MKVLLCKGPLVAKEGTGLKDSRRTESNQRKTDEDRDKKKNGREKEREKEVDSRAGVAEIKRSPGVDQEQSR